MTPPDAETVAQWFHEAYERLAPRFNYETRKESAVPWADVPLSNRLLMTEVAREVLMKLSQTDERSVFFGSQGDDPHGIDPPPAEHYHCPCGCGSHGECFIYGFAAQQADVIRDTGA